MPYITSGRGSSSGKPTPDFPSDPNHHSFAREATIAAFGRHARALDQGGFVDVKPNWRRIGPIAEAITKKLERHRRSRRATPSRATTDTHQEYTK